MARDPVDVEAKGGSGVEGGSKLARHVVGELVVLKCANCFLGICQDSDGGVSLVGVGDGMVNGGAQRLSLQEVCRRRFGVCLPKRCVGLGTVNCGAAEFGATVVAGVCVVDEVLLCLKCGEFLGYEFGSVLAAFRVAVGIHMFGYGECGDLGYGIPGRCGCFDGREVQGVVTERVENVATLQGRG